MKPIGYIIYQFWDSKWKMGDDKEWTITPSQPMPAFKKKIYETESSAKEAVEQLSNYWNTGEPLEGTINYEKHQYFILPIFTPEEEFDKVKNAYWERRNELEKNKL